jgi:hypothetical protein
MYIHRLIKNAAITLAGLGLACSVTSAEAQTTVITGWTNTFPNNGNTGFYQAPNWIYWYGLYQDSSNAAFGDYNLAGTNDAAVDYTGDTNDSGSMYVYAPWNLITNVTYGVPSADQNVFDITFGGGSPFDQSQQMQIITATNLSWYIRVKPGCTTDVNGNFGTLAGGFVETNYTALELDYLTIPGAATNGWVLMAETNAASFIALANTANSANPNSAYAFAVCFDQNSYGSSPVYPTNTLIYWIDNITVQSASKPPPPPPPPTLGNPASGALPIARAVQGLNLFTGNNATLYNRQNIQATGANYTWVGASGPVSYSFTITNYPVGTNDAVQCQIFLIPNPGAETAPDYTEPNLVFLDLESDTPNGGGAQWNFRYKTNEANGNAMVYGAGTLASLGTNTAIGTWTVTFTDNTNVTMTIPGGASTNFSIPDPIGATAALFATGVNIYFGSQAGNGGGANDHFVASEFKVTGTGSDFDDNFVADNGVLNSVWTINAVAPTSVQMLGAGNPYWITWTTPAPNFQLETTSSLSDDSTWTAVTNHAPFNAGTNLTQLVSTNDLQPGSNAFFALIQHNYQLQVLWPGETAAPGTPTGKTGTPTPISLSTNGPNVTFTVNAVDAKWNLVPTINDTVAITSSDTAAGLPGNAPLSGGTGQFTIGFATPGKQTATASDVSNSSVASGTSSPITVTQ